MLEGTLNAKIFCEKILSETDVSLPEISVTKCYEWINSELFYIYSHIVRSLGMKKYICDKCEIDLNEKIPDYDVELDPEFDLLDTDTNSSESTESKTDKIVFEDVYKMYDSSGREFVRTSLAGAQICPMYCYYKDDNKLKFNTDYLAGTYRVVYLKRPALISSLNAADYIIPFPDAFSSVFISRIKKEIFLLSGDIEMSNAWSDEHLRQLQIFSDWYKAKEGNYIK